MNLRVNANAIVTNSKGELLLVMLKKGPFTGGISIPGGGINPGELLDDAVRREVFEETGVRLKGAVIPVGFCELIHEGVQDHRIVLIFHSSSDELPDESDEASGMWINYKDAKSKLIPFAREAIKMWKEKKAYFKLVGEETGITRKYS